MPSKSPLHELNCAFQRKYAPFAGHACAAARHTYEQCEYEDYLIRIKEYERERRLLQRMRRKQKKAAEEAGSLAPKVES